MKLLLCLLQCTRVHTLDWKTWGNMTGLITIIIIKLVKKMFYFLDIVWMHIGCASFTICFFLIQSSFCADLFPATAYGFLQSSLEILRSLKNGSQVKISKNLKFSGLPKTKKTSLSPVGTFHISTKSQPPFALPLFFW
jgi:hypothetical protein